MDRCAGFHTGDSDYWIRLVCAWQGIFAGALAQGIYQPHRYGVRTTVALLDSIHVREALENKGDQEEIYYSVNVISFLDLALGSLKNQAEKTYSAPFATHLYAKETVELPGGANIRLYPRLKYGGAHLENPVQDKSRDIMVRGLSGSRPVAMGNTSGLFYLETGTV